MGFPEKGELPKLLSRSQAFGQEEGLWAYRMARSVGIGTDNRSIQEAAEDAVRTAVRILNRDSINTAEAAQALKEVLLHETGAKFEETEP